MIERLRAIADVFGARGVRVALETGQEQADTLLGVLEELDRPDVGVNFDPAIWCCTAWAIRWRRFGALPTCRAVSYQGRCRHGDTRHVGCRGAGR